MAHLGEFGRALQDMAGEPDTFTFHGQMFVVPPKASALPIARFAWQTKVGHQAKTQAENRRDRAQNHAQTARTQEQYEQAQQELAEAEADVTQAGLDELASIWDFFRAMIDPSQFDRLYEKALEVGADTEELFEVCAQIAGAVTGRPTRRPSESSGGPSMSGRGSTVVYGSPEPTPGPSPAEAPVPLRAVEMPAVWEPPRVSAQAAQRAEFRAEMVPVQQLIRSGG